MLPTQNVMDYCDLSDAYDIPTIDNLMMSLEESVGSIDMDYVKKFSDSKVFSISSCWSSKIYRQKIVKIDWGVIE